MLLNSEQAATRGTGRGKDARIRFPIAGERVRRPIPYLDAG